MRIYDYTVYFLINSIQLYIITALLKVDIWVSVMFLVEIRRRIFLLLPSPFLNITRCLPLQDIVVFGEAPPLPFSQHHQVSTSAGHRRVWRSSSPPLFSTSPGVYLCRTSSCLEKRPAAVRSPHSYKTTANASQTNWTGSPRRIWSLFPSAVGRRDCRRE